MPSELKRVKAIFSEALELAGAEREAFIVQACGDDLALRADVQAYLHAAEDAGAKRTSSAQPSAITSLSN